MKTMNLILMSLMVMVLFTDVAYAQTSIWGATDRTPLTATIRLPVDTGASSTPGYVDGLDILNYVQTNTAADNLSNISTTGVATGDLLYYSVSGFVPLNIDEIVQNSGDPDTVEIGNSASANSDRSLAIGVSSTASAIRATALGAFASASGVRSSAYGYNALSSAEQSTAFGGGTKADMTDCTALGYGADCSAANQIMMGTATEDVYIPGTLTVHSYVSAGHLVYASTGGLLLHGSPTSLVERRECVRLSDVGADAATGTGVANLYFNDAITITGVYAFMTVAPVGSTAIIDINDGGTTIMTTNKLSVDASEKTSGTAATAAGVTDTAIAANAEITFDIDQIGSSTAGQGYVACIEFTY